MAGVSHTASFDGMEVEGSLARFHSPIDSPASSPRCDVTDHCCVSPSFLESLGLKGIFVPVWRFLGVSLSLSVVWADEIERHVDRFPFS